MGGPRLMEQPDNLYESRGWCWSYHLPVAGASFYGAGKSVMTARITGRRSLSTRPWF